MIEIEIDSKSSRNLENLFIKMETNIKKPIVALKQIGAYMLGSINKNFENQGRPTKWAPLAPSTIAGRRNKNKASIKILQDTGYLKNSITYDATDDEVKIGTNVIYGKTHQFGADIKTRSSSRKVSTKSHKKTSTKKPYIHIPARPFLLFQNEDKDAIREILIANLMQKGTQA